MAGGRLIFDKHTENLAEIAMTYVELIQKYPLLADNDSTTWKQKFVEWANEFEELHLDVDDNPDKDYLLLIDDFAKQKILEFGGIEEKPFYFTFGSLEKYPYQNRYLVVYAENAMKSSWQKDMTGSTTRRQMNRSRMIIDSGKFSEKLQFFY